MPQTVYSQCGLFGLGKTEADIDDICTDGLNYCAPGTTWDYLSKKCTDTNGAQCDENSMWNANRGACVQMPRKKQGPVYSNCGLFGLFKTEADSSEYCQPGYVYCDSGTTWDFRTKKCQLAEDTAVAETENLQTTSCGAEEYKDSDGQCIAKTACKPHEKETYAGSSTADRTCQTFSGNCANGNAVNTTDRRADDECASCDDGYYLDGAICTAYSAPCNKDTHYQSKEKGPTNDRTCTPLIPCRSNEYESPPPQTEFEYYGGVWYDMNITNRGCNDVTSCTSTQYETKSPTATSNRECADKTVCKVHEKETDPGSSTTDRTCASFSGNCANGDSLNATDRRSDDECGSCDVGYYLDTDKKCKEKTVCQPYQKETYAGSSTADRTCQTFTGNCANGNAVNTTDRRADDECASCNDNYYLDGKVCKQKTACQDHEKETNSGGGVADRTCETFTGNCINGDPLDTIDRRADDECGSCDDGYYLDDKTCKKYSAPCNKDTHYQSKEKGPTNDRTCTKLTVCGSRRFESKAPDTIWEHDGEQWIEMNVTDRTCTNLSQCSSRGKYESSGPTKNNLNQNMSDKECTTLTNCADIGKYQSKPPTKEGDEYVADRECAPLTECNFEEWESKKPWKRGGENLTNRECSLLTKCGDDQYQEKRQIARDVQDNRYIENRKCKDKTTCELHEKETDEGDQYTDRTCEMYSGTCANGTLLDPVHRRKDDHCGSCDPGHYLEDDKCKSCDNPDDSFVVNLDDDSVECVNRNASGLLAKNWFNGQHIMNLDEPTQPKVLNNPSSGRQLTRFEKTVQRFCHDETDRKLARIANQDASTVYKFCTDIKNKDYVRVNRRMLKNTLRPDGTSSLTTRTAGPSSSGELTEKSPYGFHDEWSEAFFEKDSDELKRCGGEWGHCTNTTILHGGPVGRYDMPHENTWKNHYEDYTYDDWKDGFEKCNATPKCQGLSTSVQFSSIKTPKSKK